MTSPSRANHEDTIPFWGMWSKVNYDGMIGCLGSTSEQYRMFINVIRAPRSVMRVLIEPAIYSHGGRKTNAL